MKKLTSADLNGLISLSHTIADRMKADPGTSYIASLVSKGPEKIAQKVGEEAVEVIIAACKNDHRAIVGEAADLIFHVMVLLEEKGLSLGDITDELMNREGLSGLTEKANRKK